MPDTTTTTARIVAVLSTAPGSLVLRARGLGTADELRRYLVPPGALAAGLALAMGAGETWRLTLASDGETVLEARYGEGVEG
jgi:hypothetical protein